MQDNQHRSDIGEAFENKAWEDMESILNREMPVRKKKRRFLWWWLGSLLFLGVLGGMTWYRWTYTPTFEKRLRPATINEKLPLAEENKTNTTNEIIAEEEINKSFLSKRKIEDKVEASKNRTINHTPKTTFNPSKYISDFDKERTPEFVDATSLVKITQPTDSGNALFPTEQIGSGKDQIEFSYLESLPFQITIPKRSIIFGLPSKIVQPVTPQKLKWGLRGGVSTFNLVRVNEFFIGGFAQLPVKENWALQFGLEYKYLRTNLLTSSSDKSILDDTFSSSPEVATAGGVADTDTPTGGLPIENMDDRAVLDTNTGRLMEIGNIQYLSMPIYVEHHLNTKLSANIGTTFHYAFLDSYESLGTMEMRLRRLDISSSVGLGYSFNQDIGVQLSYDRGWFEKRKELSNAANQLPSLDKQYSPLEGRLQLTGYWNF